MNYKRYRIIIDIINIMLRFSVAFSIMALFFLSATGDRTYVWKLFYVLPVPFVSYIISKWTKRLWAFIILHILVFAAYAGTIDDIALKATLCTYIIVLAVLAFTGRIRKNSIVGNTHMGFIATIVITCIYCEYMKLADMERLFLGLAFLYILLFLINFYLLNFKDYFINYEAVANIPIRQITSSNHMFFAFFAILCLGVMLIGLLFPMKNVLLFLGGLIVMIAKTLAALIHPGTENPAEQPFEEHKEPPIPTEVNPILELIGQIFMYIILIMIIVAVIFGIIYGCYLIYNKFYANKANGYKDRLEFISPFENKKAEGRQEHKPIRKWFHALFGKTNNERIRKHYYNSVMKNTDSGQLTREMTPTQLSRFALSNDVASPERAEILLKEKDLTALYEKARYGREECSKKELIKVKEILK